MFDLKATIGVEDTRDKIIFWDIDGTLAPYRYNGHVADPEGTSNGQSMKEIEQGIFFERKPSRFMQSVLRESQAREHIVMGHCICEKEVSDKQKWLDVHYPFIKKRLFAHESKSKAETILNYCRENAIDLQDVLFVDDRLAILKEAERKGIQVWHISSFLDWYIDRLPLDGKQSL